MSHPVLFEHQHRIFIEYQLAPELFEIIMLLLLIQLTRVSDVLELMLDPLSMIEAIIQPISFSSKVWVAST